MPASGLQVRCVCGWFAFSRAVWIKYPSKNRTHSVLGFPFDTTTRTFRWKGRFFLLLTGEYWQTSQMRFLKRMRSKHCSFYSVTLWTRSSVLESKVERNLSQFENEIGLVCSKFMKKNARASIRCGLVTGNGYVHRHFAALTLFHHRASYPVSIVSLCDLS
ncbi:hypothetical protein BT93_K1975 [Corymbia citriodora subsp. variegata]|nr:hypothetical protein BT93_K1975 [Corymbia citriodora subsp. variegata]